MSLTKLYSVTDDHGDSIEVIESAGLVDVTVEEDGTTSCVILTVEQAEDLIEALELAIQDACLEDDPYDDEDFDLDSELDTIFDETSSEGQPIIFTFNNPPAESAPLARQQALDYVATFFD